VSTQRYHIGKNGPAPCNAHPERPNGRACRFGHDRHGTLEEVTAYWESEQEAEHEGMLIGKQKAPEISSEHAELRARAIAYFANPENYETHEDSEEITGYSAEDIAVAIALAEDGTTGISYARITREDTEWRHNGSSSVERFELDDGTAGYFKSIRENSLKEHIFRDQYDTSSLAAAVAEVNAYRLSQVMGRGFDELVPETAFRETNDVLGTIQREAPEDYSLSRKFKESPELREDYRKAALFDFVIGNMDRNEYNYLYGAEDGEDGGKRARLRLIDHSFAFPRARLMSRHYMSIFGSLDPMMDDTSPGRGYTVPQDELNLKAEERKSLSDARTALSEWVQKGTIEKSRGESVISRIDFLLEEDKLSKFEEWYDEHAPSGAEQASFLDLEDE